uniref:NAD-dependent epimerase/dehydratase domain-containing protein n=1 Tax=Fagus sylvatica TaxID=28930 RepID=A0A2N9IMK1_FAGSY
MGKVKPNTPVALVVGVTGMVGLSLAEALASPTALGGPWKVYGAARRPKPTWFPSSILDLYITFDALNFDDTLKQLSPIAHEVTHVFWLAIQVVLIWAKHDYYCSLSDLGIEILAISSFFTRLLHLDVPIFTN